MESRFCKSCGVEKPLTAYPKRSGYKDGIRPHCVDCRRKYEVQNYHRNKHKRPYIYEQHRDIKLRRAYGLNYGDYEKMFADQNGLCAICGTSDTGRRKAFHVDHCHETGKIRGLLCGNCNSGIGNLRDDIGLLNKAIKYLEGSRG
jgi:hypothetical protein